MKQHVKFEHFSGYLNYLGYYQGYGGMQWNDMYEMQDAFINQHTWCDTGYNNDLSGHGEAITLGTGGFQSYDLGQSFSLVSGNFASAWEANQPVTVNSYTYTSGQGFSLKASDVMYVGQYATKIHFSNYGSDFKDISAVSFVSGVGSAGNTCSYGTPTYGYILVMDNLDVKWSNGTPAREYRLPQQHHVLPPGMIPHLNAGFAPTHMHGASGAGLHQHGDPHLSGHDGGGGWTPDFGLPQAEHHFGF